jgi:hypothetical protein
LKDTISLSSSNIVFAKMVALDAILKNNFNCMHKQNQPKNKFKVCNELSSFGNVANNHHHPTT